jgi:MFS family permease
MSFTMFTSLRHNHVAQVIAVGLGQLVAWASSIYLPAVTARPLARDLDVAVTTVFAALSFAIALGALVAPAVGRAIDRRGGRQVLCLSNGVLAAGLTALALCGSATTLFLAWGVIGIGMALGLYDSAFSALVRQHGAQARGAIIGVTLLGGFASSVGWPLTDYWVGEYGWRVACLLWAGIHLLLALPLNALFLPALAPSQSGADHAAHERSAPPPPASTSARRTLLLVALFGATTSFVMSAMAAHLPALLLAAGVGAAAAIAASSLMGVAQVAARLVEVAVGRYRPQHPLRMARFATMLHPLAGAGLLALGISPLLAAVFAFLHGAGNGMITIAKGALPLALFGPHGYGARQGWLAVSQRLSQALAPFVFGAVLERWGASAAIGLSTTVSLLALGVLMMIRAEGAAR